MRALRAKMLSLALLASAACAHAAPATGNHTPDAPLDSDNPEQNCHLNNTVDCRPSAD